LHDEVRTAVGMRNLRAGNVESSFGVGGDNKSTRRSEPDVGNSRLPFVLIAIGIFIIENFTDNIGTIERGIGNDADCCRGNIGYRGIDDVVRGIDLIGIFAFGYAGTSRCGGRTKTSRLAVSKNDVRQDSATHRPTKAVFSGRRSRQPL
ncbi:MAG: hypothetical protein MUP13_11565, partial [Thermoanaerobaculales bacterium]|nr:hypothetical protein [Thermoanaerobaculales bacterium]